MGDVKSMGRLYLCATPIGNMEDITLRVLRVLNEADAIYAEDTRHTLGLLNHYDIKKPLVSCHEHNENARAEEIVNRIIQGERIVFVSDAGMPAISDPGEKLVSACIKNNVPFEVLPGASASLCALVLSGMPTKNACFAGFLPRSGKERKEEIACLSKHKGAVIIYESPLRVSATLSELSKVWGERDVALVREITKHFEETVRGTLLSLSEKYSEIPPKGECVIVVAPQNQEEQASEQDIDSYIEELLKSGMSVKDASKQASVVFDIKKSDAYAKANELKLKL
ncbi:MAG: 16S rRNA (cytidine(1402)-2'-O)-methyltransferase [Clostridia bacterium]|nr:16S rRNA (cytidine(1402)-2'-O)-methyltransferase [Clostridia bacterium]